MDGFNSKGVGMGNVRGVDDVAWRSLVKTFKGYGVQTCRDF